MASRLVQVTVNKQRVDNIPGWSTSQLQSYDKSTNKVTSRLIKGASRLINPASVYDQGSKQIPTNTQK